MKLAPVAPLTPLAPLVPLAPVDALADPFVKPILPTKVPEPKPALEPFLPPLEQFGEGAFAAPSTQGQPGPSKIVTLHKSMSGNRSIDDEVKSDTFHASTHITQFSSQCGAQLVFLS